MIVLEREPNGEQTNDGQRIRNYRLLPLQCAKRTMASFSTLIDISSLVSTVKDEQCWCNASPYYHGSLRAWRAEIPLYPLIGELAGMS